MHKLRYFLPVLVFLAACNSGTAPEDNTAALEEVPADTTPVSELASFKFSYTIANLPPPMKILDEFSRSDLPANVGLLNPVGNASNYHTTVKQAFNYGVYGVDLAYAVFNERTPEILKYYPVVKRLAGELDMAETFNSFVERFEDNSENRDSLTQITDEIYTATDSYLRSNERLATASEILAGSWLECQYIVVNLLVDADRSEVNEPLYQRIWEQRLYLDNISQLLNEFEGDEELEVIRDHFRILLDLYQEPASADDITTEYLGRLAQHLDEVRGVVIN